MTISNNKLIEEETIVLYKIKLWLQNEIENTELYDEKFCENKDDFIHYGRQECANNLFALKRQAFQTNCHFVKLYSKFLLAPILS